MKNKKLTLIEKLGVGIMFNHADDIRIRPNESDPEFNDVEFCVERKWGNVVRAISGKTPQELFDRYCDTRE